MQQHPLKKIVVIVGPTASGKTALSVRLAQDLNGEVISADSRQVYRSLDIGTEKITEEETCGIPHHLIDIRDLEDVYTAAEFVRDADHAIADISARGALPIIAGGTFLYVDALLGRATLPAVPPDPTLRATLEQYSTEALFEKLAQEDPVRATSIDPKNRRRLIRALEIAHALGAVPMPNPAPRYDALLIGIETSPEDLRQRIEKRLAETLKKGLVQETEDLLLHGLDPRRLDEIGLEYRLVRQYLIGTLTYDELQTQLAQKVWQYAKRQRTWLKRMERVHWYARDSYEEIAANVGTFLGRPSQSGTGVSSNPA